MTVSRQLWAAAAAAQIRNEEQDLDSLIQPGVGGPGNVPVDLVRKGVTFLLVYNYLATFLFCLIAVVLMKNGLKVFQAKRFMPVFTVLGSAIVMSLISSIMNSIFWASQLLHRTEKSSLDALWLASTTLIFFVPLVTQTALTIRMYALLPPMLASTRKRCMILATPVLLKCIRLVVLSVAMTNTYRTIRNRPIFPTSALYTANTWDFLMAELWLAFFDSLYATCFLLGVFLRSGRRNDSSLLVPTSGWWSGWFKLSLYACMFSFMIPTCFSFILAIAISVRVDEIAFGYLLIINVILQNTGGVLGTLSSQHKWRNSRFSTSGSAHTPTAPTFAARIHGSGQTGLSSKSGLSSTVYGGIGSRTSEMSWNGWTMQNKQAAAAALGIDPNALPPHLEPTCKEAGQLDLSLLVDGGPKGAANSGRCQSLVDPALGIGVVPPAEPVFMDDADRFQQKRGSRRFLSRGSQPRRPSFLRGPSSLDVFTNSMQNGLRGLDLRSVFGGSGGADSSGRPSVEGRGRAEREDDLEARAGCDPSAGPGAPSMSAREVMLERAPVGRRSRRQSRAGAELPTGYVGGYGPDGADAAAQQLQLFSTVSAPASLRPALAGANDAPSLRENRFPSTWTRMSHAPLSEEDLDAEKDPQTASHGRRRVSIIPPSPEMSMDVGATPRSGANLQIRPELRRAASTGPLPQPSVLALRPGEEAPVFSLTSLTDAYAGSPSYDPTSRSNAPGQRSGAKRHGPSAPRRCACGRLVPGAGPSPAPSRASVSPRGTTVGADLPASPFGGSLANSPALPSQSSFFNPNQPSRRRTDSTSSSSQGSGTHGAGSGAGAGAGAGLGLGPRPTLVPRRSSMSDMDAGGSGLPLPRLTRTPAAADSAMVLHAAASRRGLTLCASPGEMYGEREDPLARAGPAVAAGDGAGHRSPRPPSSATVGRLRKEDHEPSKGGDADADDEDDVDKEKLRAEEDNTPATPNSERRRSSDATLCP